MTDDPRDRRTIETEEAPERYLIDSGELRESAEHAVLLRCEVEIRTFLGEDADRNLMGAANHEAGATIDRTQSFVAFPTIDAGLPGAIRAQRRPPHILDTVAYRQRTVNRSGNPLHNGRDN